jgi:exodeoxyribonuclease VIII
MKRNYISHSALKAFAKSPNHYLQYVAGEAPRTDAMIAGSALHCFVLEPHEFDARYIVAPKIDRRTKEGKQEFEAFSVQATGRDILTLADFENIVRMRDAIFQSEEARGLIESCMVYEQSIATELQGIEFRGVADGLGANWILDIKTTQDASPEAFQRQAFNLGYHEQAALYTQAFGEYRFYWIVVESAAPHNVAVYQQSARAHRLATDRVARLIEQFKNWDGTPAGYFGGVRELDLPNWA